MCHGECRVSFVIVGATGLRNVSTFGKLDPYVKISYGKSVYRTSVIHDGGCSPRWNYEMCLTGKEPDLRVEVFDSHFIKDKLIGSADIRLSNLPPGRQDLNVNLTSPKYSGSAGTLRVIFKVYGDCPSFNYPPTCCATYASCSNCSISPPQGSICPRPTSNCFAIPIHSMSYPILPQQQSQTSLVPAVTKDSCILQGLPVTCYIQAPCTHGAAIPVSRCPTSPYSEPHPSTSSTAAPYYYYNNGNRGSTEYTKVMDAPTWVVSPSTVFTTVQPN